MINIRKCLLSKLQNTVSTFTTKAEYVAATEASKELLWMKVFLVELGVSFVSYHILSDSQSAIHFAENDSFYARIKHIDVWCHTIRLWFINMEFGLVKIHTDSNR